MHSHFRLHVRQPVSREGGSKRGERGQGGREGEREGLAWDAVVPPGSVRPLVDGEFGTRAKTQRASAKLPHHAASKRSQAPADTLHSYASG